jgi:predicted MPP superfamily phosphohydrolase
MRLLHVADIHFRHPQCSTGMDPEQPYRTALVRHLSDRVDELGRVDVILVGGDIAYGGVADEYVAAKRWLKELADAAQCGLADVLVVPGNHDVDREVIRKQAAVRNAQAAIFNAPRQRKEQELLAQFLDSQAGTSLLAPIGAYNEFAAAFSCQLYSPGKLFWLQERPLGASLKLRIYGLTSTLLSGIGVPQNNDDTRDSLYLSRLQTVLDPLDGVVNAVLVHHPPDWFVDHDEVDDAVRGRAALHFFGHKHRQRIHRDPLGYVRLAAGAVSPDPNELGWEPGYNIVELHVKNEGDATYLDVTAHIYRWQTDPDRFVAKVAEDDRPVYAHRIKLARTRQRASPRSVDVESAEKNELAAAVVIDPPDDVEKVSSNADEEVAMSEPGTRNLVFRFWSLTSSQRREIALRLKLIDEVELELPEPERYGRALVAASKRGLLDQVAAEVQRMEGGHGG